LYSLFDRGYVTISGSSPIKDLLLPTGLRLRHGASEGSTPTKTRVATMAVIFGARLCQEEAGIPSRIDLFTLMDRMAITRSLAEQNRRSRQLFRWMPSTGPFTRGSERGWSVLVKINVCSAKAERRPPKRLLFAKAGFYLHQHVLDDHATGSAPLAAFRNHDW